MPIQCQYSNCTNEATTAGHIYGHTRGSEQKDRFIRVNACDTHKGLPEFIEECWDGESAFFHVKDEGEKLLGVPELDEIKAEAEKRIFNCLGFGGVDGTYVYHLTRVKEAFRAGTITLEDFVEVDGDFVGELADLFAYMARPLLQEIERLTDSVEMLQGESRRYAQIGAEVIEERDRLLAEIERKDEVLRFYADERNHQNVRLYAGFDSIVKQDGGQRAREAQTKEG